jgi:hypothetical protein
MKFKLNNQVLIHLDVGCYDVCIIIDAPLGLWSSVKVKINFDWLPKWTQLFVFSSNWFCNHNWN